jgi:hypothetical protein
LCFELKHPSVFYRASDCDRATIFRRDALKVISLQDLQSFMQANDWENDPLSLGCASNQIAARDDLNPPTCDLGVDAGGAIDAKVTSVELLLAGSVLAISGPTHEEQPPFAWTGPWAASPHAGQPTTFDFDWVLFGQ